MGCVGREAGGRGGCKAVRRPGTWGKLWGVWRGRLRGREGGGGVRRCGVEGRLWGMWSGQLGSEVLGIGEAAGV